MCMRSIMTKSTWRMWSVCEDALPDVLCNQLVAKHLMHTQTYTHTHTTRLSRTGFLADAAMRRLAGLGSSSCEAAAPHCLGLGGSRHHEADHGSDAEAQQRHREHLGESWGGGGGVGAWRSHQAELQDERNQR